MPTRPWIDTHCHLDAPEFDADRAAERARARDAGVGLCVIPAVAADLFAQTQAVAHAHGDAYALGIHPLCTPQADAADLERLAQALQAQQGDAHLVAIGEIGLDYFVLLDDGRQQAFYRAQLELAKEHRLPVLLHVRKSVDRVLKHLRELRFTEGGIAHAFNGSQQQAHQFLDLGFKLGFGGATTYERASRLRDLAARLPADAIVMETDAPDIPPHWLYVTAEQRQQGQAQGRNSPAELPRIGALVAGLRGVEVQAWRAQSTTNALQALPRLAALVGA